MKQRPVDANSLHGKFLREYELNRRLNKKDIAGAWQGAMQLLYDAPTIEPARQEWISVKDRLPEKFQPVIICRRGKEGVKVEEGMMDIGGWWKVYGTRTKAVTHWMPLPEPPEKEK